MLHNDPKNLNFKSALVTGGGGFLGLALVRKLVSLGVNVITLQRNNYEELNNLSVKQLNYDLSNLPQDFWQHLSGVEVIFHTAAKVSMWGEEKEFYDTNVTGTQNLIHAAKKAGVKNFVFTSSPSVIANGDNLRNVDETIEYPKHFEAFYPKTKALAEQYVLSQNSSEFRTISLRPHLIYGPGDTSLEALVVKKAKANRLVKIGSGNNMADFTYIDDCVMAHINAAVSLQTNSNCRGRAFFISQGIPIKLWEWIDVCLKKNGLPPVRKKVPAKIAICLGWLLENIAKISPIKFEPPFTKFLAQEMATDHYFNISAAKKELGYIPQKTDLLNWS